MGKYLFKTIRIGDNVRCGDFVSVESDWMYIDPETIHEIDVFGKRFIDEKIVKCKDCKYYEEEDFFCHYWENLYEYSKERPRITPFDFCSRGIRKDEVSND